MRGASGLLLFVLVVSLVVQLVGWRQRATEAADAARKLSAIRTFYDAGSTSASDLRDRLADWKKRHGHTRHADQADALLGVVERREKQRDELSVQKKLAAQRKQAYEELERQAADPKVDRGELVPLFDQFLSRYPDDQPARRIRDGLERAAAWEKVVGRYDDLLDDLVGLEPELQHFSKDDDAERSQLALQMLKDLPDRSSAARALSEVMQAGPQVGAKRAETRGALESIWSRYSGLPHSARARALLNEMAAEDLAPLMARVADATSERDQLITDLTQFILRYPTLPDAERARAARVQVWTERPVPWDRLTVADPAPPDAARDVRARLVGNLELPVPPEVTRQWVSVAASQDGALLAVYQRLEFKSDSRRSGTVSVWEMAGEQPRRLAVVGKRAPPMELRMWVGFIHPDRLFIPEAYGTRDWNWKDDPKMLQRPSRTYGFGGFAYADPTGSLVAYEDQIGDRHLLTVRKPNSDTTRIPRNTDSADWLLWTGDVHVGRSLVAVVTARSGLRPASTDSDDRWPPRRLSRSRVSVWDVALTYEPRQIKEFYSLDSIPGRVAFSPSGDELAVPEESGAVLRSLKGSADFTLSHEGARTVAFSRDGKLLATGGSGTSVIVWDTKTRAKRSEIELPVGQHTLELAFAPDGSHLVSTHGNGSVRIYRLSLK